MPLHPFWIAGLLAAALSVLLAVFFLERLQRRPSLRRLVQQLHNMRLDQEPKDVLGHVLAGCNEVLKANETVLLFYFSGEEQLYRWSCRHGDSEATMAEVPPRELDAWIVLERGLVAERLDEEAAICRRLGARQALGVRFSHRANCGRLLVLEPGEKSEARLRELQLLAGKLAPLVENVFELRRVRSLAIDEERSRIACDFHDGPLQTFFSFDLHLQVIRNLLERDSERAARELEQLQAMVRTQGREMRDLIQEIRPIDMEGGTLLGLLRFLVEDLQKTGDLSIKLLADSRRVDAPRKVCREVYQIVREAITNARKHARAAHIVITVDAAPELLTIAVDDDGAGFNFSGSYSLEELDRLRVGPVSIKQRVHSLGAALTLESTPGHGSRLLLRVPLAQRDGASSAKAT